MAGFRIDVAHALVKNLPAAEGVGAHLPQPEWFADVSVEARDGRADSTLTLYRELLAKRRELQAEEDLEWVDSGADVIHVVRRGTWHSITNFGTEPVALPDGDVVATSSPLAQELPPSATTAWVGT